MNSGESSKAAVSGRGVGGGGGEEGKGPMSRKGKGRGIFICFTGLKKLELQQCGLPALVGWRRLGAGGAPTPAVQAAASAPPLGNPESTPEGKRNVTIVCAGALFSGVLGGFLFVGSFYFCFVLFPYKLQT